MDNISYIEAILKLDKLRQEINDLSSKLNETKSEEYLLNKYKLLTEKKGKEIQNYVSHT